MPKLSYADVRLNYDPAAPPQRYREAGLEAAFTGPSAQLTPTYPTSHWYEYRHGVNAYIPLVTGHKSPAAAHQGSGVKLGLSPVRDAHEVTRDVEPSLTAKEKR
jgi:hypothetical protein